MYNTIQTEIDCGVGIITLNRPERHNGLDAQVIHELVRAVGAMGRDDAVRVVVLSSTGKTFCAGADLEWLARSSQLSTDDSFKEARVMAEMLKRLATMHKPTVARIQGPVFGSGIGLVSACDVAIATFDVEFCLSEVRFGLVPAVISPHVIAAIGERYARRYMLTAESFAAAEAYRIGLIHEMVPDIAALDEAVGMVVAALLRNGPQALAECKDLIRTVTQRSSDPEMIDSLARRIARARGSDEGREGVNAFLEKRKPNWIAHLDDHFQS